MGRKLACVCVVSKRRYTLGHTYTCLDDPPSPARVFLCHVLLTSFRDKNPPPLILFLQVISAFLFFCFVLIPTAITAFTRQRSRPAQSLFEIRYRRVGGEGEREGLDWSTRQVPEAGPQSYLYMALTEGPHLSYVNVTRRSWTFACFSRDIQGYSQGVGEGRGQTDTEREESMCGHVDGSSRS